MTTLPTRHQTSFPHDGDSAKSIDLLPGAKRKLIEVVASNQSNSATGEATKKFNVFAWIYYNDNTKFGPIDVAKEIDIGRSSIVNVDVPDKVADLVTFVWNERIGNKVLGRAAFQYRDSKYVGDPWDSAVIVWYATFTNNTWAEFTRGGISVSS